LHETSA